MKKLLLSLLIVASVFTGGISVATAQFDPFGAFGDGFGLGDKDGDGQTDLGTSAENYLEGIGEDITTDIFGNTGIGPIPDGEFSLPCPEEFNSIGGNTSARQFILNVVNYFLTFLGIIAIVVVIYAGFLYLTDAGEGSNQEKAKKTLMYAVIGILIVLGSFALVNTVLKSAIVGSADNASDVTVPRDPNSIADPLDRCRNNSGASLNLLNLDIPAQNGLIINLSSLAVVKNGESVTYQIELKEFNDRKVKPQNVFWNFGDGWVEGNATIINNKYLEYQHKYFDDGKRTVAVIVTEDDEGVTKKYRLTKNVLVGNAVKAQFFSSNFFPDSAEKVTFDGSSSRAYVGSIQEYQWSASRIAGNGKCEITNGTRPKFSAEFFNIDANPLICAITLTVGLGSSYNNITDSVTETVEISSRGGTPKPIINTIRVQQDSENNDDEHLFKVQVWVHDKIDFPLENFRYEVWDGGYKLLTQFTTFGIDPANNRVSKTTPNRSADYRTTNQSSGSNSATAGPPSVIAYNAGTNSLSSDDGYRETYSEMLLDLSRFPGERDLIFRVIATNSYSRSTQDDTVSQTYTIPGLDPLAGNLAICRIDFMLPGNIGRGGIYRTNVGPGNFMNEDTYTFNWTVNGQDAGTGQDKSFQFHDSGMQTIRLQVDLNDGQRANCTPTYGWTVTRNIFVKNEPEPTLSHENIDFTLPAQITLGETHTPTVSPNEKLNPNIYAFQWKIGNRIVSSEKNPNLSFDQSGLQTVTLSVGLKNAVALNTTNQFGYLAYETNQPKNITFSSEALSMGFPTGDGSDSGANQPVIPPNPPTLTPGTGIDSGTNTGNIDPNFGGSTVHNDTGNSNTNTQSNTNSDDFVSMPSAEDGVSSFGNSDGPTFQPLSGWVVTKKIFVGQDDASLPYKRLDFDIANTFHVDEIATATVTPNGLLDEAVYNFQWRRNGELVSEEKNPQISFHRSGLTRIALKISVKDSQMATFNAVNGWQVVRTINVTQDAAMPLGYDSIDFTLPAQILPGGEFAPIVSPERKLDEAIYNFSWQINQTEVANVKNPRILFENTGLQRVTLTVTTKSDQQPNFLPLNGWQVTKNIFVGADDPTAPYKRLDFTTPFYVHVDDRLMPAPLPNNLLEAARYDFSWQLNDQEVSTDKFPEIYLAGKGSYELTLSVDLKDGAERNFQSINGWFVSKTIMAVTDRALIQNSNNTPPIVHYIPLTPGNGGNTNTTFSVYPITSDPDGDALTYQWDFGDGTVMDIKNVAHRYNAPGEYLAEFTVSDGLSDTIAQIKFTVVAAGEPIPKSTVEVYVRQEPSDLDKDGISIKNKAPAYQKLQELEEQKQVLTAQLGTLNKEKAALQDELVALNSPEYKDERIALAQAENTDLQAQKTALTAAAPEDKVALEEKIAALEAQIETTTTASIQNQKDNVRIRSFEIDEEIATTEKEINTINEEIKALRIFIGEDFMIEGTLDTTFFLYADLPTESARAILAEWHSGDGQSVLGQKADFHYEKTGIFRVELRVTDGQNTFSDYLKIKINPPRIQNPIP